MNVYCLWLGNLSIVRDTRYLSIMLLGTAKYMRIHKLTLSLEEESNEEKLMGLD